MLSDPPSLDVGQIARHNMKLAVAVGDKRHFQDDDIVGRHFIQTGQAAGLNEAAARSIFADLLMTAPAAIEGVLAGLPECFPSALSNAISRGFIARLALLAQR